MCMRHEMVRLRLMRWPARLARTDGCQRAGRDEERPFRPVGGDETAATARATVKELDGPVGHLRYLGARARGQRRSASACTQVP
jgi:hypothetical protein